MRCCAVVILLVAVAGTPVLAHEGHGADDSAEPSDNGADVRMYERDGCRYVESTGLPNHDTGDFPNRGNPNTISEQHYQFRMPLEPQANDRPTPVHRAVFGVAVNGVPFDPGTNEYWNNDRQSGWRYEAMSGAMDLGLDENHAHVQPSGAYHYHALPTGLVQRLGGERQALLLGYAADGFPIYGPYGYADANDPNSELKRLTSSYRLKQGNRPAGNEGPGGPYDGTFVQDYEYVEGAGDLDECNGRFGVTPEYPQGTYYYVITDEFPYVARQWKGTPDESFYHRGGPPGMNDGRSFPPPPPGRRPMHRGRGPGFPPPPERGR